MNGTQPPPSQWPTLRELRNGELVDNDDHDHHHRGDHHGKGHDKHHHPHWQPTLVEANKAAMGFPSGVPGIPDSIFEPENFIFPVFDYDWGRDYDHSEANGVPTNAPPPIRHVIKMLVPRVNADGNELGGVPTVQVDAPLGTYLGWNITAGPGDVGYDGRPFHAGQVCNYVGGMVPFFKKKARSDRRGRSAPFARGALRDARRLCRRSDRGREQRVRERLPAGRGPRRADRSGGREQRLQPAGRRAASATRPRHDARIKSGIARPRRCSLNGGKPPRRRFP